MRTTPTSGPALAILAPAPLLTITIEVGDGRDDEIHVHPGGQGYWVARLAAELGAEVTMCASFGGETGVVVADLLGRATVTVVPTEVAGSNGAYVHDRRHGERTVVATTEAGALDRHEVDDLFGSALAAGAAAGTLVLAGLPTNDILTTGFYTRLTAGARRAGATVVADVSGGVLAEVLEGGVDVLKVSDEELARDHWLHEEDASEAEVLEAMAAVHEAGAEAVVVSRAASGTLVLAGGEIHEASAPRVEVVDPAGAGDSLTAAMAVTVAAGGSVLDGVRLGTAAAALNVTRHGLGSGRLADIEAFASKIELRRIG